jgi:hypothetical protein
MIIVATVILLCLGCWLLINWGCVIPSRKGVRFWFLTTLGSKTTVTANWLKGWRNEPDENDDSPRAITNSQAGLPA